MKIAIVTCNFASIDKIKSITKQTIKHDTLIIDETILKINNYSNRVKSKYIKTKLHLLFHEYDLYIYIDGTIEISNQNFVQTIVNKLNQYDALFVKHSQRETIKHECEFLLNQIETNKYFSTRYDKSIIEKQKQHYNNDAQLYFGGVFARKKNIETNYFFNRWWDEIIKFGFENMKDQIPLAHLINENKIINTTSITCDELNKYITWHEHDKLI